MSKINFTLLGVVGSSAGRKATLYEYGSNSSSVFITTPKACFIFDAGTGIFHLNSWFAEHSFKEIHLFLTHYHWDHIQGLPLFNPLYDTDYTIHIYGPEFNQKSPLFYLKTLFKPPYYPAEWSDLKATLVSHTLTSNQTLKIESYTIKTILTNHPSKNLAYSFIGNNKKFAYITDLKLEKENSTELIDFCKNASVILFDAHFSPNELKRYPTWGHSSWEEGVYLAQQAQAGKLLLSHHAPSRTKEELEEILFNARKEFEKTELAKEGDTWSF